MILLSEFSNDKTKEFFAKQFYNRAENLKANQISGMLRSVINFALCFKGNEKEVDELKQIFTDPIAHVLKEYGSAFDDRTKIRIAFKVSLAKIEWLYFRDVQSRVPLTRAYYGDNDQPRFNKKLTFDDLVTIREFILMSIEKSFVEIASKNDFDFGFDVASFSQKIQQVEATRSVING